MDPRARGIRAQIREGTISQPRGKHQRQAVAGPETSPVGLRDELFDRSEPGEFENGINLVRALAKIARDPAPLAIAAEAREGPESAAGQFVDSACRSR